MAAEKKSFGHNHDIVAYHKLENATIWDYERAYEGADERFIDEAGFVKVGQDSGGVVVAYFWHPITGRTTSYIVYDADSGRQARKELRWPLFAGSKQIEKAYKEANGIIEVGSKVEVFKGRKFPIGMQAVVEKFYTWYGRYGQTAEYVVTTEGSRIPLGNVKLVVE